MPSLVRWRHGPLSISCGGCISNPLKSPLSKGGRLLRLRGAWQILYKKGMSNAALLHRVKKLSDNILERYTPACFARCPPCQGGQQGAVTFKNCLAILLRKSRRLAGHKLPTPFVLCPHMRHK